MRYNRLPYCFTRRAEQHTFVRHQHNQHNCSEQSVALDMCVYTMNERYGHTKKLHGGPKPLHQTETTVLNHPCHITQCVSWSLQCIQPGETLSYENSLYHCIESPLRHQSITSSGKGLCGHSVSSPTWTQDGKGHAGTFIASNWGPQGGRVRVAALIPLLWGS